MAWGCAWGRISGPEYPAFRVIAGARHGEGHRVPGVTMVESGLPPPMPFGRVGVNLAARRYAARLCYCPARIRIRPYGRAAPNRPRTPPHRPQCMRMVLILCCLKALKSA